MSAKSTKEIEQQNFSPTIIIDSNMIQHFLNKEVGKALEPLLQEIAELEAILAVSEIVVYESLKAIVFNPEKFQEVSDFFEKYLVRFPVDETILIESARLHEMYGTNPSTKGSRTSYSTEDVIIATTAMIQGAYILTCDGNDFPMPFFKEVNRQFVPYVTKGRRKNIVVYLLEPDSEAILDALSLLNNKK